MSAEGARKVAVIDYEGNSLSYDGDGFSVSDGVLYVLKDGDHVAIFAPGWRSVAYAEAGQ